MRKSKIIAAICLLVGASASAYASSWHLILSSNDETVRFFDAESVEKTREGVTVWLKIVRLNGADAQGAWSNAIRWRVDCAKKTIQTLALSDYDEKGNFIKSYEGRSNAKPIVPDSVGDTISKIACKSDFPKNTSETDYIKVENNDVHRAARVWAEALKGLQDKAPK